MTPIRSIRHNAEDNAALLPPLIALAEKAAHSVLHGHHGQKKSGTGEDFWTFRDYRPSDRPQDIDWRKTARGTHILVREKEWQKSQTVQLWCDPSPTMNFSSSRDLLTKRETAAVLGMALGLLMRAGGEQIALCAPAQRAGHSASKIDDLGTGFLERHCPSLSEENIDALLGSARARADVFFFSDFLVKGAVIEDLLKYLQDRLIRFSFIQVLDPAELTLPYAGHAVVADMGGAIRERITDMGAVRAEYLKRLRDHNASVRDMCAGYGGTYWVHNTASPAIETLRDVLSTYQSQRKQSR